MPAEEASCPNCGAPLTGRYCASCGQQRIDDHEYSLGHFLAHSLHDLTHLDAKVLGSLLPLLTKPGKITLDYLEGRRGRYLRPLQTFIIINIIFFVAASAVHAFSFTTAVYLKFSKERSVLVHWRADELFKAKVSEERRPPADVARELDEKMDHLRRTLLLPLIPAFAIVVMLLERGRGRRYIEHLIFSIHFFSFWLLLLLAVLGVAHLAGWRGEDPVLLVFGIITIGYLTIALKRVYGASWLRQSVTAILLTVTVMLLLAVFRDILFLAALASI